MARQRCFAHMSKSNTPGQSLEAVVARARMLLCQCVAYCKQCYVNHG